MNVLVTGGAGYIGSHAALRLLAEGHAVTILDDLSRGNRGAVKAIMPLGDVCLVEADVGDRVRVERVLADRCIDVVMHFAAKAYVGESVKIPLQYYRANTAGALGLLEAMSARGVDRMVFSSTCAVYGEPAPEHIPIGEACPRQPVNPYGRSKLAVEQMLGDHLRAAGDGFAFGALRYFNVAGCDAAGRLGEDHDPETHLIPICLQASLGRRQAVTIFGTDYDTPDGTCIRDYIHVTDLAEAHLLALDYLKRRDESLRLNLGNGQGYSVREVIELAERVTGRAIETRKAPRRKGDPPRLVGDATRARRLLNWIPRYGALETILEHAWKWHRKRFERRRAAPGQI